MSMGLNALGLDALGLNDLGLNDQTLVIWQKSCAYQTKPNTTPDLAGLYRSHLFYAYSIRA